MIYFGGCWHHYHTSILKWYPRGFADCEAMWQNCIDSINVLCSPQDHIIYCGDFIYGKVNRAFCYNKWEEFRKSIKCKNIIWIRGNHDKYFRDSLEWKDYYEVRQANEFFICSHYPMLRWNGGHRGSFMIHSHSHSNINDLNKDVRRIDVGYDSIGKWLISLDEIKELKHDVTQNYRHH